MYLIKFNVSNPNRIPVWVRRVKREEDKKNDTYRAMKMKAQNGVDGFVRAKIGRVRESRVDTGLTPGQRDMVASENFHQVMTNLGQNLVDVHSYAHQRDGRSKKFVLVFVYDENPAAQITLTQKQWANFGFFQEAVWKYCHLWINPEADNITINFTSLSDGQLAQLELGTVNGLINFVPLMAAAKAA